MVSIIVSMNFKIFKYFLLHFLFILKSFKVTTSEVIEVRTIEVPLNSSDFMDTVNLKNENDSQPVAEQLIQRYPQEETSVILIKHLRPKNYIRQKHMKKPKVKYNFAEPPHTATKTIHYDDSIEDYNSQIYSDVHLTLSAPGNYDTQNFDVKFYDSYESSEETPKSVKEYNDHVYEANEKYKEVDIERPYNNSESTIHLYSPNIAPYLYDTVTLSHQASTLRKPQAHYGIPKRVTGSHSRKSAIKYGLPYRKGHHHFAEPPSLNFDLPRPNKTKRLQKPTRKPTRSKPSYAKPVQGYDYTPPKLHTPPMEHKESPHVQIIDYIPSSNDLPINQQDKVVPYGYSKTSYEVPLYDAMPFDMTKYEDFEIFPPHTPGHQKVQTHKHQMDSQHSPSSFNRYETSSVPHNYFTSHERFKEEPSDIDIRQLANKHILDTPELQRAFEQHKHLKNLIAAPSSSSSSSSKSQIDYEIWNPVKMRSSNIITTAPTESPTIIAITTSTSKHHYKNFYRGRTATTEKPLVSTTINGTKIEILAIDESRSVTLKNDIPTTSSTMNSKPLSKPTPASYFYNRRRFNGSNSQGNSNITKAHRIHFNGSYKLPQRLKKTALDIAPFESPHRDFDI